ncbi:MAG: hypothetical protein KQI35_14325 [Bacteroidetes bacterium]|nr:hypothetical protein [Bacteroidota bacterium]
MEQRYSENGIIIFKFLFNNEYRAIKFYSLENTSEAYKRGKVMEINREYEIARIFAQRPNIINVYRHDKIRIGHQLVGIIMIMEYFPLTLEDLFSSGYKFSEIDVLLFLSQMATALNALKNATPPVIHFDIKPSNIGVNKISKNNHLYVLMDFDVSVQVNPNNISFKSGFTPAYAPPELLMRYYFNMGELSQKVDIYSVGAIAMRMITGFSPQKENTQKYSLPYHLCDTKWRKAFNKICNPDPIKRSDSLDKIINELGRKRLKIFKLFSN